MALEDRPDARLTKRFGITTKEREREREREKERERANEPTRST